MQSIFDIQFPTTESDTDTNNNIYRLLQARYGLISAWKKARVRVPDWNILGVGARVFRAPLLDTPLTVVYFVLGCVMQAICSITRLVCRQEVSINKCMICFKNFQVIRRTDEVYETRSKSKTLHVQVLGLGCKSNACWHRARHLSRSLYGETLKKFKCSTNL